MMYLVPVALALAACSHDAVLMPDLPELEEAAPEEITHPGLFEADTEPTDLVPADRISEQQAMDIAAVGQTSFVAQSSLVGPADLPNGDRRMVYAVTLSNDSQVLLRYVDVVTGEVYAELDEVHDRPELGADDTGTEDDLTRAWYTNCPGGWICIRNPPSNIAFYSQRDGAWAGDRLGNSNLTIGGYGCLLSAYAMALREEGYGTRNPRDLNNLGIQRGCFQGALIVNACLVSAAGGRYNTISVNNLWSTIASGRPVVAYGTSNCLGGGTHAQMIWGHDGARYWTKDPWFDYRQQDQSMCLSNVSYRTIN